MESPRQLWGEPEAGVQSTLDGGTVEYHPKGAGRKVQITLDDYARLESLKSQGADKPLRGGVK